MLSKNISDKSNFESNKKNEFLDVFNFQSLNYNKDLYNPKKEIYQTYYGNNKIIYKIFF